MALQKDPNARREDRSLFEGFSNGARRAIERAHGEAQRLNQEFLGPEHLLLGLLRERDEGVCRLLAAFGLDPEKTCREAEFRLDWGPGRPSRRGDDGESLPLTSGCRRVLQHARMEAGRVNFPGVAPEHLLVGLLCESNSVAADILQSLGVTLVGLRKELTQLPEQQGRDRTFSMEPAIGLPVGGNSLADLDTILSEETPSQGIANKTSGRRPKERRPPREPQTQSAPSRRRRPSDEELDFPVIHKQLRALQYLVGALGGAFLGQLAWEGTGGLIGWLVGCAIAAIRISSLGALAGLVTGVFAGWSYSNGQFLACLVWGLAGLALGACLGDWRRLPAPPGGSLSSPEEEELAERSGEK